MGQLDAVRLHRVTPEDWRSHRDLRLEMLQDTPDAFWSTYEREAGNDEAQWRAGIERIAFLQARAGQRLLGSVGLVLHADPVPDLAAESSALLIAMYVVPSGRRHGVGSALVGGALELAREHGRQRVLLEVTSSNHGARALYERMGFVATGASTAHPRRAELVEHEMVCELAPAGVSRGR